MNESIAVLARTLKFCSGMHKTVKTSAATLILLTGIFVQPLMAQQSETALVIHELSQIPQAFQRCKLRFQVQFTKSLKRATFAVDASCRFVDYDIVNYNDPRYADIEPHLIRPLVIWDPSQMPSPQEYWDSLYDGIHRYQTIQYGKYHDTKAVGIKAVVEFRRLLSALEAANNYQTAIDHADREGLIGAERRRYIADFVKGGSNYLTLQTERDVRKALAKIDKKDDHFQAWDPADRYFHSDRYRWLAQRTDSWIVGMMEGLHRAYIAQKFEELVRVPEYEPAWYDAIIGVRSFRMGMHLMEVTSRQHQIGQKLLDRYLRHPNLNDVDPDLRPLYRRLARDYKNRSGFFTSIDDDRLYGSLALIHGGSEQLLTALTLVGSAQLLGIKYGAKAAMMPFVGWGLATSMNATRVNEYLGEQFTEFVDNAMGGSAIAHYIAGSIVDVGTVALPMMLMGGKGGLTTVRSRVVFPLGLGTMNAGRMYLMASCASNAREADTFDELSARERAQEFSNTSAGSSLYLVSMIVGAKAITSQMMKQGVSQTIARGTGISFGIGMEIQDGLEDLTQIARDRIEGMNGTAMLWRLAAFGLDSLDAPTTAVANRVPGYSHLKAATVRGLATISGLPVDGELNAEMTAKLREIGRKIESRKGARQLAQEICGQQVVQNDTVVVQQDQATEAEREQATAQVASLLAEDSVLQSRSDPSQNPKQENGWVRRIIEKVTAPFKNLFNPKHLELEAANESVAIPVEPGVSRKVAYTAYSNGMFGGLNVDDIDSVVTIRLQYRYKESGEIHIEGAVIEYGQSGKLDAFKSLFEQANDSETLKNNSYNIHNLKITFQIDDQGKITWNNATVNLRFNPLDMFFRDLGGYDGIRKKLSDETALLVSDELLELGGQHGIFSASGRLTPQFADELQEKGLANQVDNILSRAWSKALRDSEDLKRVGIDPNDFGVAGSFEANIYLNVGHDGTLRFSSMDPYTADSSMSSVLQEMGLVAKDVDYGFSPGEINHTIREYFRNNALSWLREQLKPIILQIIHSQKKYVEEQVRPTLATTFNRHATQPSLHVPTVEPTSVLFSQDSKSDERRLSSFQFELGHAFMGYRRGDYQLALDQLLKIRSVPIVDRINPQTGKPIRGRKGEPKLRSLTAGECEMLFRESSYYEAFILHRIPSFAHFEALVQVRLRQSTRETKILTRQADALEKRVRKNSTIPLTGEFFDRVAAQYLHKRGTRPYLKLLLVLEQLVMLEPGRDMRSFLAQVNLPVLVRRQLDAALMDEGFTIRAMTLEELRSSSDSAADYNPRTDTLRYNPWQGSQSPLAITLAHELAHRELTRLLNDSERIHRFENSVAQQLGSNGMEAVITHFDLVSLFEQTGEIMTQDQIREAVRLFLVEKHAREVEQQIFNSLAVNYPHLATERHELRRLLLRFGLGSTGRLGVDNDIAREIARGHHEIPDQVANLLQGVDVIRALRDAEGLNFDELGN